MKNKKVCLGVVVIAIIAFLLSYIISYANTGETIYVNLTNVDTNGVGYRIGKPTVNTEEDPATNAVIWNITTYDSASATTASRTQRNLYCIKANYGDTWNKSKNTKIAYNLSYDLQADRQELLNKIVGNSNDADSVVKKLLTEEGHYRELLWILDNSYIEGQTDKKEFLSKMGFQYDEASNVYVYQPIEGYNYNNLVSGMAEYNEANLIKDSDIKAVQRAAIWYYTNYMEDPENNAVFNQKTKTDWLNMTLDGTTYEALSEYNKTSTTDVGALRNEQAMVIYNYLIDAAANNASQYTAENNYTINKGTTINTTGLNKNSDGKYRLSTTRIGTNYVVGPIKIDGDKTAGTVTIKVTNQNNTEITGYKFTNSTGTALEKQNIQDLIGNGEFYILVPRDGIEQVNVKINVTQETTKKTLWLNGTEDANSIKLNAEQPIVEVTRKQETTPTEFVAQPEEFDLALRKYITQVNGQNVANTRIPSIDLSTLKTGTTATYKHRKDPVTVKDKDEVTYNISIYNEGNKAGYATKIVDQLPTGLINSPNNSATVVSKDKSGNTKNTYKLTYNTVTNQITLTIVNTTENPAKTLNAYTEGNLDYETIQIKCKVAQTADTKNQIVLTNVAWIDEEYNSDDKITITNQKGADRDSEPDSSPNVNKDNMSNYKGNSNNKEDLTDSKYHYEGQQDDDDFEKLVIMPEEKIFDLALFKHIAAISKDQTIENGEYVTDNKNIDGTYLRAPVVTNIDKETGKITYKQDDKEALIVEPGDYVLYTIRVYNEGEVNGYASKIKDTLPIGLEFVVGNEEYNGKWNLDGIDSDGRQVVSTTWFAKGQGAELNAVEGDANYKANLLYALNKEGAISTTEPENPDYLDAQVLCRVTENATSGRVLVNYAQIADDSDENGNPIDDIDSTPDNFVNPDREFEDDEDLERIKLRTPGQYDLVLVKEDENGEQLNSTAKFEVTTNGVKEEKEITGRLTIAKNVPVDADHLTDDVYVIKETKAPDEYCEFDGTITITVSKKLKDDGSGYEKSMKYTVIDSEGNDITNKKDAKVYVNSDGNIYVEVKNYIEPKFDLALRKFITEVQGKEVTSRVPQVKIDNGKITYEHSKDPVTVHVDDTIIYTLRVFNEGNIDGYASEIEDDIPDYLEYLPDEETNVNYMWKMYDKDGNETTNPEEAVKIKTTYLSKENGTDKLLKAFDGTNVSYQDVKIAFKVKDPKSNTTIITNHAQISDDSDKDGNPVDDIDSKPGEWNDGEDDQDEEHVKVEYFDLSLLKFVSKVIVIEDGKENVSNTGYNGHEDPEPVVKVELHRKKLNQVTVKFGYGITITNEGDIPGYATEITDYVPEGLRFDSADNPNWTDEGNNVISTRQLENTLLQPGESATVEVILTWINGPENLALKTNTAEISEDKNEYDVPDRDSTPDNRKDGEDDIDIAKVILAVSTGSVKTYLSLATGLLVLVLTGVVLIKKFVI